MTYLERITDIYDKINSDQMMDAFEKYYADDVVMILEDGTRVEGKKANRERHEEIFEVTKAFHGMEVERMAANEEQRSTFVECTRRIHLKGNDEVTVAPQVAVQQWEGDKIVRERFYGEPLS